MTVWRQNLLGAELIMQNQQLTPFSEAALWKMTV